MLSVYGDQVIELEADVSLPVGSLTRSVHGRQHLSS